MTTTMQTTLTDEQRKVPWGEDAKQPPAGLQDEVWTVAMTGYREALAAT